MIVVPDVSQKQCCGQMGMTRLHISALMLMFFIAGRQPGAGHNDPSSGSRCDPNRLFADRFEVEQAEEPGTAGYSKEWTDTTTSGAGMRRLGVDSDNDTHFLVGSTLEGGDTGERIALICFDGQVVWARETSSNFSAARSRRF